MNDESDDGETSNLELEENSGCIHFSKDKLKRIRESFKNLNPIIKCKAILTCNRYLCLMEEDVELNEDTIDKIFTIRPTVTKDITGDKIKINKRNIFTRLAQLKKDEPELSQSLSSKIGPTKEQSIQIRSYVRENKCLKSKIYEDIEKDLINFNNSVINYEIDFPSIRPERIIDEEYNTVDP
jgi:hypothetical protein